MSKTATLVFMVCCCGHSAYTDHRDFPPLQQITGHKSAPHRPVQPCIEYRKFTTDVCLHAGNVEFSTQSGVLLSMSVTICINLFVYVPVHLAQVQYADNNNKIC